MASEFLVTRFPDGEVTKTVGRKQLLVRLHQFLPPRSRARLRDIGGQWGPWRRESEAIERVVDRIDHLGIGPRIVIQREKDRDQIAIRELALLPDLGAAPEIEAIHQAVWDRFTVRSGGLWLCRFIDGTRSVSRHGYQSSGWKGAAEDIFVTSGGMPALVKVAEFIVDQTRSGPLEAATVIVDNDIWTSSAGWHVYGGQRHYHCHVDVSGGSACRP